MAAPVLSRRLTLIATLALVGGLAAACAKGGDQGAGAKADSAAAAPKTVAIIRAADWIGAEWSENALRVGLSEEGMEQGRDYVFKSSSAQGDLATLPSLVDAAVDQKVAVIVTLQDETLKAAVERVKDVPIVFHVLADPFAAGAGTSDSNHAANVTGVYSPGFGDPDAQVILPRLAVPTGSFTTIGKCFDSREWMSIRFRWGPAARGSPVVRKAT